MHIRMQMHMLTHTTTRRRRGTGARTCTRMHTHTHAAAWPKQRAGLPPRAFADGGTSTQNVVFMLRVGGMSMLGHWRSSQAAIAQLAARRSHNPKVVSSILTGRNY